jgi:hypothetical protein
VLKELTVTRFRFGCTHCQQSWTADYDVQHVEDGHGHAWDYYSLNGSPVPPPTAPGEVWCPGCGASRVHIELIAARPIPLAQPPAAPGESTVPRERADAEQLAARRTAPLLVGDEPSAPSTPGSPEAADT